MPGPGKAASPRSSNAFLQVRSGFSPTSRRRATSATESVGSGISLTAWCLNSAVYGER